MAKLKNPKHEAVLQHYVGAQDRVGWKSYQHVYPKAQQRAAEVAWSRLLTRAEFSARKDELESAIVAEVIERTGLSIEKVVDELALLGFSNIADFIGADGAIDLAALKRERAAAISEISVETTRYGEGKAEREVTRTRLKLHGKEGPLVNLLKHLGGLAGHHATPKGGKPAPADAEKLGELEIARRIAFALELGARKAAAQGTTKGKPDGKEVDWQGDQAARPRKAPRRG